MPAAEQWAANGANLDGVDPRLLDVIRKAAEASPYTVQITSAHNSRSSTPWHPSGRAIDVQLYDENGKAVPNYQNEGAFRTYEDFAQTAREIQQKDHPDLGAGLRWGGYFSGPFGKYGAMDLMHFDTGGDQLGSGGGDWDNGLSPAQRRMFPNAVSVGMKDRKPSGELSDQDIEAMLTGKGKPAPSSGFATASRDQLGAPPPSAASTTAPAAQAGNGTTPAATDTATPAGAMRISVNAAPGSSDPAGLSDADIEAMMTGKGPAEPQGGQAAASPSSGTPPARQPASGFERMADTAAAFGAGALDLPIVGPAIKGALRSGSAALASKISGRSYDEALSAIDNKLTAITGEHPWAETAGNVYGNVAAMAPIMVAAPGAFGITGANAMTRFLAGGATGAAIGGSDQAIRSDGDPTQTATGAAIGGGIGALAPPIGKAVGAGINAIAGRAYPAAVANVNKLLETAGLRPDEAQTALSRMGPSAVLADLDPALTTEAGALAARGGKTTSVLKGAMAERAAGADNRVAQTFDRLLGPKPDLSAELEAAHYRASTAAGPHYDAAKASGQPVNVDPILRDIEGRLNTAAGGEADVLRTVRSYLVTNDGLPKVAPDTVLKARQAMDDLAERLPQAETSAGRNARNTLNQIRGAVDAELKTNPHIAAGDKAFSGEMGLRDAMQEGSELFKRGTRPEEFFQRLITSSPAEVQALRAGARVAIGDALEQASRGEMTGARQMFGKNSANRAKLTMLYPQAGEALDQLATEAAMRATEARVAGNSATAERIAAAARYNPAANGPVLSNDLLAAAQGVALGDPTGGVATALARRTGGNLMSRFMAGGHDRLAEGTADRLAASGSARDAFMRELIAANSPGARSLGDTTALGVNALLEAAGSQGRRRMLAR